MPADPESPPADSGSHQPPARLGSRFSRRQRLSRAAEFRRVFADPVKSSDRFFTVLGRLQQAPTGTIEDATGNRLTHWLAKAQHSARLGLAISRRCARRAVDRHRIKRIIREGFRRDAVGRCPIDIVVTCRPAAAGADSSALHRSIRRHLSRLREFACAGSSD